MHDAQDVALRRELTGNVVEGRQTPRRLTHRRRFLPAGGRRAYSLLRRAWRLVRAFGGRFGLAGLLARRASSCALLRSSGGFHVST
jgi:hypothetical protein